LLNVSFRSIERQTPDQQQKELRRMHETRPYSIGDLAELFSVLRPTVYRTLARRNRNPPSV